MRRRRRNRGTWFPVNPTGVGPEGAYSVTYYDTYNAFTETRTNGQDWGPSAGADPNGTECIPLTLDYTIPNSTSVSTDPSLRDLVEGQDWLCQRIVGKVWASVQQSDETTVNRILLAMAMCVIPFKDFEDIQIPAIDSSEYDPTLSVNVQQPFMWRRTWVLGNNLAPGASFLYPTAIQNTSGGGTFDGGHVDCKVKRRIRREERLCIVTNARLLETNFTGDNQCFVNWGYDFRIFGGMRRSQNSSSFK